ncbi:MAG: DUF1467 family protein [Acetobacteraceae bacterium]
MNWFTGVVLYILIWWVSLFAVLPIGTQPEENPDDTSGWRGAPRRPRLARKIVITTLVAAIVWGGAYLIVTSDYLSFRHGILAAPQDD